MSASWFENLCSISFLFFVSAVHFPLLHTISFVFDKMVVSNDKYSTGDVAEAPEASSK